MTECYTCQFIAFITNIIGNKKEYYRQRNTFSSDTKELKNILFKWIEIQEMCEYNDMIALKKSDH